MKEVFVLYSVDQNDETTILMVFRDYATAKAMKEDLLKSSERIQIPRSSLSYKPGDKLYIDVYEVWK